MPIHRWRKCGSASGWPGSDGPGPEPEPGPEPAPEPGVAAGVSAGTELMRFTSSGSGAALRVSMIRQLPSAGNGRPPGPGPRAPGAPRAAALVGSAAEITG